MEGNENDNDEDDDDDTTTIVFPSTLRQIENEITERKVCYVHVSCLSQQSLSYG